MGVHWRLVALTANVAPVYAGVLATCGVADSAASTPLSFWGPLRPLCAGQSRGQPDPPASILSLSLALRSHGSSADSDERSGTVLRTKVQDGLWRERRTNSASGWGLRYRMDAVEHARPVLARSRLPQGGRVPCGCGACTPPIPASPAGVQTGSEALRVTLLLQVKSATPPRRTTRRGLPPAVQESR